MKLSITLLAAVVGLSLSAGAELPSGEGKFLECKNSELSNWGDLLSGFSVRAPFVDIDYNWEARPVLQTRSGQISFLGQIGTSEDQRLFYTIALDNGSVLAADTEFGRNLTFGHADGTFTKIECKVVE